MRRRSAYGCLVVFFFQAEDGIRDYKVTGVQTCALPISRTKQPVVARQAIGQLAVEVAHGRVGEGLRGQRKAKVAQREALARGLPGIEIGRASCRERV